MFEVMQEYFSDYSLFIVFFSAFAESLPFIGLAFPGSLLVLFGGYFAQVSGGALGVLVSSAAGMFIGDLVTYWLGKHVDRSTILKNRLGDFLLSKEKTVQKMLDKYGVFLLVYSHIVGYLRSILSFVAGMSGYSFKTFALTAFFASFLWSSLFTLLGYYLARSVADMKDLNMKVVYIGLGLIGVFLVLKLFQILVSHVLETFKS